jgi:hypothetical protein
MNFFWFIPFFHNFIIPVGAKALITFNILTSLKQKIKPIPQKATYNFDRLPALR